MQKYIQTKNLPLIFDLSCDFFKSRMGSEFIEGVHFFIPPHSSRTKKAVLWEVSKIENWLKGNQIDAELEELLNRA